MFNFSSARTGLRRSGSKRLSKPESDLNNAVALCIRCLKAIMNYRDGFHRVLDHQSALNLIVLALALRESPRVKILILEMLAGIIKFDAIAGRKIVLDAFDNMKIVCSHSFLQFSHQFSIFFLFKIHRY